MFDTKLQIHHCTDVVLVSLESSQYIWQSHYDSMGIYWDLQF